MLMVSNSSPRGMENPWREHEAMVSCLYYCTTCAPSMNRGLMEERVKIHVEEAVPNTVVHGVCLRLDK